jgi:UrcA family protein
MNITNANAKATRQMTWAMLAAVGVTLLASAVQADEVSDAAPQLVVHYADLNLATNSGVAVLYHRIQNAATQVCGSVDQRELARVTAAKACQDTAIARAVAAINNPVLTAQYLAKTGGAPKPLATASR